ncbi:MAG TPA: hypothetical protein PKW90_07750, partial [Myxococcota bacterium]|nr:hypothetical protein [Myxococcota bacterium]
IWKGRAGRWEVEARRLPSGLIELRLPTGNRSFQIFPKSNPGKGGRGCGDPEIDALYLFHGAPGELQARLDAPLRLMLRWMDVAHQEGILCVKATQPEVARSLDDAVELAERLSAPFDRDQLPLRMAEEPLAGVRREILLFLIEDALGRPEGWAQLAPLLRRAYADPHPSVRLVGATLVGGERGRQVLEELSREAEPMARMAALAELGREPELIEALADPRFQEAAIDMLARMGTAAAVPALRAAPRPHLRRARSAVKAIQSRLPPSSEGLLQPAGQDGQLSLMDAGGLSHSQEWYEDSPVSVVTPG